MQLILPDLLSVARNLSLGASWFILVIGLCLWAFGWRWHRFWVVFSITLGAGILGLQAGQNNGGQVLVVGILLAVTAGMLALEIARIMAFITGGTAAWLAAQSILPQAQELWAAFLSGGLLGIVLFQLWTMLTTSFLGVMLCGHMGLIMTEQLAKVDAIQLANKHAFAANSAMIVACLLGIVIQTQTAQSPVTKGEEKPASDEPKKKSAKPEPEVEKEPEKMHWWKRVLPGQKAA